MTDLGIDLPPCPPCTNALRPRGVPRDVATGGLSRRARRRPPHQEATLAFRGDLAASAAGALKESYAIPYRRYRAKAAIYATIELPHV
jgi:hypothetical protein